MKKLFSTTTGLSMAFLSALLLFSSCNDDKKKVGPDKKFPKDYSITYKVSSISNKDAKLTSLFVTGAKTEEEKKDYTTGTAIAVKRNIKKKGEKVHIRAKVDKPTKIKLEISIDKGNPSSREFDIKDVKNEAKLEYTF